MSGLAIQKGARHEEETEARPERLRVTLKFTGHRKQTLREILSTAKGDVNTRSELEKRFPGFHRSLKEPESGVEERTSLSDEVVRDERDCLLGAGCEQKVEDKECVMCFYLRQGLAL